jgi:hypothetical protein
MRRYGNKKSAARQATYDNIIRRMRFACWITKATDTQYAILIDFSTITMVMRTRLRVTFYVHFLSYCSVSTLKCPAHAEENIKARVYEHSPKIVV